MKKLLTVMLAFLMLVGCSTTNNGGNNTDSKHIEDLELQFVPSKDADVIISVLLCIWFIKKKMQQMLESTSRKQLMLKKVTQ